MDVTFEVSGKWRVNGGTFSQVVKENGRERAKLIGNNGQAHEGLLHAEQLYDFSPIFNSAAHVAGLERLWNLNNMAYSIEFYLYADPTAVGPAAKDLATGGRKRVKAARARATVSLRAKWHSKSGEYWNYTYNGERTGRDYEGWVEVYDPDQFAVRKIDINEIYDWAEAIERRIYDIYREWADKEMAKPAEERAGFLQYATYRARAMYSAHLLRERYLPLEVLTAVVCRIPDFEKAAEVLQALPASTTVSDFDWRRVQLLYS